MYTSPIFLDSCESCGGVWIDNGELKQMKDYLEAAKTPRTANPALSEAVATLDVMIEADHEKAQRAHRIAWAMSRQPWVIP